MCATRCGLCVLLALLAALCVAELSAQAMSLPSSRVADFFDTVVNVDNDCPSTCGDGEAWCKKRFDRGGVVTLGARCGSGTFECVCNDVVVIEVTVSNTSTSALQCSWTDAFDMYPDGEYCYSITSLGPSTCGDISNDFCDGQSTCVQNSLTGVVNYVCTTCAGEVYKIDGTAANFSRSITAAPSSCSPQTTCKDHGCCNPAGTCDCFYEASNGYWTGTTCESCADGFQGSDCRAAIPTIQILLSSIAKTWTMVAPNMAVILLFVILGLARRLWESDRTFQLTRLRRANLSPVQVARRGQQGLFHSNYIPRRPANSRSFVKEEKPKWRGPPAY